MEWSWCYRAVPQTGNRQTWGEKDHDSDTEEVNGSSVGHFSDPKEFDENADDSDPSCNPMCPMPCQRHKAGYSSTEDSDDVSVVQPENAEPRDLMRTLGEQYRIGCPAWWPAESGNICHCSTTQPKPETTAGTGSPCQDLRSKNVLNTCENTRPSKPHNAKKLPRVLLAQINQYPKKYK